MAESAVPAKPVIRVQAGTTRTWDSFQNFASRVGIGPLNGAGMGSAGSVFGWGGGQGVGNPSGGSYGFNPITRNRTLCEWMYRGSWIVQRAVDAVAEDMTRKGVELKGVAPEDNELIDQQMAIYGVWNGIKDTIRWARLFGGAIGIMLIDGQDTASPLRVETIAKDQFKGLLVLDRWVAWPNLNDLVTDLGPELGKPKYYDVPAGMPGVPPMKVHHSRCIRLEGHELPYFQKWAENGWGASIIEVLYDRLVAFDSTTQGTAQLVYRAHLRTIKVQKLREIIASGGPPMEALLAQMEMIRRFQVNEGLTLIDANDEFEAFQYAFGGLNDVLTAFGDQLCGALRIPRTRLFGESPGGMDATGESDMQGYEQDIASEQNAKLRRPLNTLLQVVHRSVLGRPPQMQPQKPVVAPHPQAPMSPQVQPHAQQPQQPHPAQQPPQPHEVEQGKQPAHATHDLAPPGAGARPPEQPPQKPPMPQSGQPPHPGLPQPGATQQQQPAPQIAKGGQSIFSFVFKPLREMTEKERGEIAQATTSAIVQAFQEQIVTRERALQELKQSSEITGIWTTITAEDIADAQQDPPISDQMQQQHLNEMLGPFGLAGGQGPPKPGEEGPPKPGEPPGHGGSPIPHQGEAHTPPKPSLNAQGHAPPGNVRRLRAPIT